MRRVTSRLFLDPLRVEDADEMVTVLADGSLYEFTGGEPPTLDELRGRYERQVKGLSPDGSEEWHNWIIRDRDDGRAVGFVQATIGGELRDRAELGWLTGVAWQGRGYASEAVQALADLLAARGVTTIAAHIHPANAASAAVAKHIGLSSTDETEDGEVVWRRTPVG